jgi:PAS domain S-box-containing protein
MKGSAPTSEATHATQLHLLEQLVTHVDAVLWLTTPDKREMTYVSPGLERVFGVTPAELQARPGRLLEVVHPDDRAALRESMAEQGKGPWERRYRILRGGEVRWVWARAFPVHDRNGELSHIAGITEDITDKVRAEAELSSSRQRFEALADHSGVGIWEIDRDGHTVYLNASMRDLLELDEPAQIVGQTFHSFFTPESLETMRREHGKRASGRSSTYQVEIVGQRGGRRHVMVSGAPRVDEHGALLGLIGTFCDMTETRRLEQALSQAQKLEAIGQLAAGVAHDFNNLLIPILGYSEMAIDTVGQGQVAEDLRAVIQAGQQAKELTTQLLAFARKQALDMRPLALSAEVSGFASVLRRMLRENVTLQLELDDDVQLIRADQTQIRQVLMNLVSNAQDAMPSGGKLSIGVRTLVVGSSAPDNATLTPGAYLELSVSDSGTGMDAATQARIFEPFFTTKPAERGTGLGLAMVYGCVHQHGGQVQLRSAPGRGTTFRLFFPVIDATAPSPVLPSLVPPARRVSDTVLLVEDQDAVRKLVARVLRDEGYEVVQAADGNEALLRASEHQRPIGLLVSDVIMPNMGGYELLERLRRAHGDMRALFLSGYSEEAGTRPRELDAHFLPKPFAVAALKRVVRQVLANETP